jgi:two-component system sensor histidine kinase BaeS
MLHGLRYSLRSKLLAAHFLVVVVGVVTLLLAMGLTAPTLFDQLMTEAMGPQMRALGHLMTEDAATAMRELTVQAFRQAVATSLTWAASAAALTAIVVSIFVSGRIARPVLLLLLASRRIAAGRYAERVPAGDHDELGQLAASFNEMAGALEAAERRRRELIGDVAHELRTPIANLQGYVEGLSDGVVQPSEEIWAFLLGETLRLRRLVEDLQELSRAEARQISINPKPIAPDRLANLVMARLGPEFAVKRLTIATAVDSRLPRVLADEDRAVQVLGNLLSNALRYTPEGGRVEVSANQLEGEMVFRVRDTGIGVAPEHLPHLFERFYRTDKARTRAAGGSGIGLTIAQALVEAMGGRIWAESRGAGQGSTFSFTLPLAR